MHGDRLQRLGSSPLWVHERLSVIQPQLVIHGVTEFLFATQTAFRRSYRNVPPEETGSVPIHHLRGDTNVHVDIGPCNRSSRPPSHENPEFGDAALDLLQIARNWDFNNFLEILHRPEVVRKHFSCL